MNETMMSRRDFGKVSGLALAALALPALGQAATEKPRILKSIKFGMFGEKLSIVDKFKVLQKIGYDGVELNSPGGVNTGRKSRETPTPVSAISEV